jgi:glycosyltransferase involved in cell wall biosynthesis
MPSPQLTAVICFANEGEEVENTVASIRCTAGDDIDIVLVNDASTDGTDYESVAARYSCRYLENESRIGPAHSRHKGVSWARTDNVIMLDAHMRFYAAGWHTCINTAIEADPDVLFCTRSRPLKAGGTRSGAPVGEGASVTFLSGTFEQSLKPAWNITPLAPSGSSYIPCVLGGNYAVRRDFFLRTGGYRGLHRYGGEEPLISIKAWLAGGGCKVLHDVEIGHIYRGASGAPWRDLIRYQHFNKLATCAVVMDEAEQAPYFYLLADTPGGEKALAVFKSREPMLRQAHRDFTAVQQRDMPFFHALNVRFRRGEPIGP